MLHTIIIESTSHYLIFQLCPSSSSNIFNCLLFTIVYLLFTRTRQTPVLICFWGECMLQFLFPYALCKDFVEVFLTLRLCTLGGKMYFKKMLKKCLLIFFTFVFYFCRLFMLYLPTLCIIRRQLLLVCILLILYKQQFMIKDNRSKENSIER